MNEDMPRPHLPHLHRERTRHGSMVWYVRIEHGKRIRLRAAYGSPEFAAEYQAAIDGRAAPLGRGKTGAGTLAWLLARYRDSSAWASLSMATRRQRENIFKHILATAGHVPFDQIDRSTIVAGRERRRDRPAAARHFIETMRGLFRWAVDAELVASDPTRDVTSPKKSSEGHHVWSDDEVARFEARWPLGTRERLAFDILIYTGLRRGDVARLGRQHVRDGVIRLDTEKTGQRVTLPVLSPLAESIAATKSDGLAFIATDAGNPMTKESFGNWFGESCRAAGVPGTAHGLRKVAATRAANAGATVAQLEAIFGWRGGGMASLYTRKADRERLSISAIGKLMPEQKPNSYSRTPTAGAGEGPKNKGKSNA